MDERNQESICRLYLDGMAQEDIAEVLDISVLVVEKVLRNRGIEIVPWRHPHRLRYADAPKPKTETVVAGGRRYKDVICYFS